MREIGREEGGRADVCAHASVGVLKRWISDSPQLLVQKPCRNGLVFRCCICMRLSVTLSSPCSLVWPHVFFYSFLLVKKGMGLGCCDSEVLCCSRLIGLLKKWLYPTSHKPPRILQCESQRSKNRTSDFQNISSNILFDHSVQSSCSFRLLQSVRQ